MRYSAELRHDWRDRMGILVMEEASDEGITENMPGGYHPHFAAWAEKDLRPMIRRDANHPCVILRSIGNEISDRRFPEGGAVAARLRDIFHIEDPTRLVTAGFNGPKAAIQNRLVDAVDVVWWNYQTDRYEGFHKSRPDWIMDCRETPSAVSSRGFYHLQAVEVKDAREDIHPSFQVSSDDLSRPGWGVLPELLSSHFTL